MFSTGYGSLGAENQGPGDDAVSLTRSASIALRLHLVARFSHDFSSNMTIIRTDEKA